jgi:hypothetical protein
MNPALSKSSYDIVIAYRIYPRVSKIPFVHKDDKLKLTEVGLSTLKNSLAGLHVKFFFILDNCPPEYEALILRYFSEPDLEFIKLSGLGNLATFGIQIDTLLNQNLSEIIYFAEDDYVHRPALFKSAVDLLRQNSTVDFVTLYDHADSYSLPIHTEKKYEIITFGGLHWRTSASTCLTFLTRKSTLKRTASIFRSYCKGNWDSSLWFALTKFNVFDFFSILKYSVTNRFYFKIMILSWINCGTQVLFGRKYKLWQPIPSIATHMEETGVAPNIDWNKVVSTQMKP